MDSMDKAFRPGLVQLRKKMKRVKPVGVDELARRYANGLDLWTGLPLKPENKLDQSIVENRSTAN